MNAICGVWPKTTLAITTKIVHMMGWIRTRPPSDRRRAGRLASTCTRRLDWAVSTIGITGQELHDDAHEILATYSDRNLNRRQSARLTRCRNICTATTAAVVLCSNCSFPRG